MAMLEEYWQACAIEVDAEVLEIDGMEDAISPLNEQTTQISALIMAFSSCYHEADKEAERIVQAIGSGEPPEEEKERPPQRQRELQNSHDILSAWCEGQSDKCANLDVGGIPADELIAYLGEPSALKMWQVQRVIDKLKQVLDYSHPYHNMALNIDGDMLALLGAKTAQKHWLAASLDKLIRMQQGL